MRGWERDGRDPGDFVVFEILRRILPLCFHCAFVAIAIFVIHYYCRAILTPLAISVSVIQNASFFVRLVLEQK